MPLPIPETKPATEFIDGELVQKMSPYGRHGRIQLAIGAELLAWAKSGRLGRVATEWDFDLTPPGERTNRLVPDVAFLSYERVGFEDPTAATVPTVAPDVAVEILSEGQTVENSARRIAIFLACGSRLVILVEPHAKKAWLIDPAQTIELVEGDSIVHSALPGFCLALSDCFEEIPPR